MEINFTALGPSIITSTFSCDFVLTRCDAVCDESSLGIEMDYGFTVLFFIVSKSKCLANDFRIIFVLLYFYKESDENGIDATQWWW